MQQLQALALQPAVWGISGLILLPSPCNDSSLYLSFSNFVKPQQWPTPSESIAIYCVMKLVSCVTHLQSCAKVHIWNKKKKLRTVAKIKTQDYKNWRLQKLSTIASPPLHTATTLFNEHRSQRPCGTSDWQNIFSAFSVVSVSDDHVVCNRPYKERRIPAAGASHWSWHQLKNFERQGMTYELLLEIFSMEKLNSLLYRNWSINFFTELLHFTVPPELTELACQTFSAARYGLLQTTWSSETETTLNAEKMFCQSEVPNGRCDLRSLNSVVAVLAEEFQLCSISVVLGFNLSNSA